jgi:acetylornithine deacetylase/succinyl-diaminopimelate desuccinylase-like protein
MGPKLTADLTDPGRVLEAAGSLENLAFARVAHACTHTTFSPNVARAGSKINIVPDRVEIEVDIRALPDVTLAEVDVMLDEALGDLRARVEIESPSRDQGSIPRLTRRSATPSRGSPLT